MPLAKLYPGAVDGDSIRGLVLQLGGGTPALTIAPAAATPVVEAVPLTARLRAELQKYGLVPWRFRIGGLQPNVTYTLTTAHGSPRGTTFRCLDPAATRLKVVVASCYYGFLNQGWSYHNTLASEHCRDAAFKLLVGDNVYLDVHPRQRDDTLDGGYLETAWLYAQYWFYQQPYAELLGLGPTLTTWDDHEFWNNYPAEVPWLSRSKGVRRAEYEAAARECVRVFQATLNPPSPVAAAARDNLSYRFTASPVSFFVADMRSERQAAGDGAVTMPAATLAALRDWATTLDRPGVLVLGQPLMIEAGDWRDHNPPYYHAEYTQLWQALDDAPFDVLVLSGDVHHSRVLELRSPLGKPVFEIVSSPACHLPPVVWHQFGIVYDRQDRGSVSFPLTVRVGAKHAAVRCCHFATDVPNTIATVSFRQIDAQTKAVEVGCTFLDLTTNAVVAAQPTAVPAVPALPTCSHPALFTLRRRGSPP